MPGGNWALPATTWPEKRICPDWPAKHASDKSRAIAIVLDIICLKYPSKLPTLRRLLQSAILAEGRQISFCLEDVATGIKSYRWRSRHRA
jgi:hypothetical protein